MLDEQKQYVFAWADAVKQAGFRPGIYCSGIEVTEPDGSVISTARDLHDSAAGRELVFWVANDACPPSPGCAFPKPSAAGGQWSALCRGLAVRAIAAASAVCRRLRRQLQRRPELLSARARHRPEAAPRPECGAHLRSLPRPPLAPPAAAGAIMSLASFRCAALRQAVNEHCQRASWRSCQSSGYQLRISATSGSLKLARIMPVPFPIP